MADKTTIDGTRGPSPKVDRASWLKTIVDNAIPVLIDVAAKKYLGGIKLDAKKLGLSTAASAVLNQALEAFKGGVQAPTGSVVRPSTKFLADAGLEMAKAFIQDRAVGAAGAPDPALPGVLDPKKTYYATVDPKAEIYKLAASASGHLIQSLFDRLHVGNFGTSVKGAIDDAVRKSTDLSKADSWVQLAKDVAVGVLKDQDRDVIGYLAGLTPAAETQVNGGAKNATAQVGAGTDLPKADGTPTATASSASRRASASTNAFATYFQSRAATGKDDKEAKKNVEELVKWGAKQLGVSDGVAQASLEKATEKLAPILAKAKEGNAIESLAVMLQELAKQTEAASRKDPSAANRFARYKMMANCASAIAQRFTQAGLTVDQVSPSVAKRLDRFMDFAVANLVAQSLGVPHKAAKWTKDEVLYLEKNQQDLETITNVLFDERIYRKMQVRRAASERPNVEYPLLSSIDPKNVAQSAAKLTELLVGEPSAQIPAEKRADIKAKLQPALETILGKGANNIDIACGALDWLSQQVPDKAILQPLFTMVATAQAPIEQCTMVLQRVTDALKKNTERQAGLSSDVEKLTKTISDLEAQPDTKDRNDAITKTRAAIKTAQAALSTTKEERAKLEATTKDFGKELAGAKSETGTLVDQLFRQVRSFIASPDSFQQAMAEWQKKLDAQSPKGPDAGDAAGGRGSNGPNGPSGPRGPAAPNGAGGPPSGGPNGAGSLSSSSRRQIEIQQRRAYECAQVLADPALSIQDKIFLFMMIYASFADQEREEKLRELNALEEHKAEWDARRQDLGTVCEERLKAVTGIKEEVDQKKSEIDTLKAGGAKDTDPAVMKATQDLTVLEKSRDAAQKNYTLAVNEYDQKAQEAGPSKNREALFLELQRVSQWRDQIMQMARSMLEESNRLVERIWR